MCNCSECPRFGEGGVVSTEGGICNCPAGFALHYKTCPATPSNRFTRLLGWLRKNEGILGLAALLWATAWWVGCR